MDPACPVPSVELPALQLTHTPTQLSVICELTEANFLSLLLLSEYPSELKSQTTAMC